MLYDPKWEVQTKADPLTLPALIAWLEQQPTRRTYCYASVGNCLLHQYFRAAGFPMAAGHGVGGTHWNLADEPSNCRPLPEGFGEVALGQPHTFGAALERARAAANQSS